MPELPRISGAEALKALQKLGTLAGLLRQAEVSVEDFIAAL